MVSQQNSSNTHKHYGLDCSYYTKSFDSLTELIDDVILSGMDPSYYIREGNQVTNTMVSELIIQ